MTPRTSTVLAVVAIVVAVAALVLALLVMQQSAKALGTLRRHRLAHKRAHGTPDPERRKRDEGPPFDLYERRRHRDPEPDPVVDAEPSTDAYPAVVYVTDETLTREQAQEVHERFVRETITGSGTGQPQGLLPAEPDPQPPTGEYPPPTRQAPAVHRPRPDRRRSDLA